MFHVMSRRVVSCRPNGHGPIQRSDCCNRLLFSTSTQMVKNWTGTRRVYSFPLLTVVVSISPRDSGACTLLYSTVPCCAPVFPFDLFSPFPSLASVTCFRHFRRVSFVTSLPPLPSLPSRQECKECQTVQGSRSKQVAQPSRASASTSASASASWVA